MRGMQGQVHPSAIISRRYLVSRSAVSNLSTTSHYSAPCMQNPAVQQVNCSQKHVHFKENACREDEVSERMVESAEHCVQLWRVT